MKLFSNTHKTITVRWNPIQATTEPLTGYLIEYYPLSTGGLRLNNTDVKAHRVATGVLAIKLRQFKSNTRYSISVRGYNYYGDGVAENIVLGMLEFPLSHM